MEVAILRNDAWWEELALHPGKCFHGFPWQQSLSSSATLMKILLKSTVLSHLSCILILTTRHNDSTKRITGQIWQPSSCQQKYGEENTSGKLWSWKICRVLQRCARERIADRREGGSSGDMPVSSAQLASCKSSNASIDNDDLIKQLISIDYT